MARLSSKKRIEAIRRVQNGESKTSVARDLGVTRKRVGKLASNLKVPHPRYHPPEVREEAIRRVKGGEQKKAVAKDLGVSTAALHSWTKHLPIRRRYTPEEREDAVRRVEHGEAKSRVALDLGIPENTLRKWTTHVDRTPVFIPDEIKKEYVDRVSQGEAGTAVARDLGVGAATASYWTRHLPPVSAEVEQLILLELSKGNKIMDVARTLHVPQAAVRRLQRIANGKSPEAIRYSDEEKMEALRAVEAGASYVDAAAKIGCDDATVLYWHRNAIAAGLAKERPRYKPKSEDSEFEWVSREYSRFEDWRESMSEWVKGETSNFSGSLKALRLFVIDFLAVQDLPATRVELLTRGTLVPSFYETACAKSGGGIMMNNTLHRFLEWVLRTPGFSEETDEGPVPLPQFRNPVQIVPWEGIPKATQSVRSVLPYGYIVELRERLAAGPNFRDWTLAQSLKGKKLLVSTQQATDWFPVPEDLIDENDPDCVWRIRERVKLPPLLEMWSPVRWVLVLLKLQLPARTGQIRMSDSGESDTFRYEAGGFVRNGGRLASGTTRKPWQQGIFRRIPHSGESDPTILYFNTNKTADRNRFGPDMGQECPWPHLLDITENPYYWLEKLRNWQEKYNPIDRRIRWADIPLNRSLGVKHEDNKAKYPDTCFLFRTPEVKGAESLPLSAGAVHGAWRGLLTAFQSELDRANVTHPDGSPVQLIDQGSGRTDYPLHGLRVSLITHLIVDGEVPAEIMMKIVGHARLIMTLYYTKPGLTHMQDAIEGAAERMDARKEESITNFLATSSAENIRNRIVFNTEHWERVLPADTKDRNPVGWLFMHDGICLAGGNTGPLYGNTKVPGCHNGGPLQSRTNAEYGPVPGGIRNCCRCRWKAAEKHHGPALAATLNNKLYHLYKEQESALRHSATLHNLKKQKAQLETVGASFDSMKDLKSAQRLHESAMTRLGNLASDVAALYRMLERVRTLPDATDSNMVLATHGDLTTMQAVLDETPSELLQLAGICGDVEIYPDLNPGTAIFRRSQLLDAALEREGQPPFFMRLSEEDMLVFGNAFMRKLASHANPRSPLLGLRAVVQIIDAQESLERFLGFPLAEALPTSEPQDQEMRPIRMNRGSQDG